LPECRAVIIMKPVASSGGRYDTGRVAS